MTTEDIKAPKRGLGRGLSALFDDEEDFAGDTPAQDNAAPAKSGGRQMLGLELLVPGQFQPRKNFDQEALAQLAQSVETHEILQPILVRKKGDVYEIIAGERRWLAAQRAKLQQVPVIIRDLDDLAALEIALIENLQREDLNAMEEAEGYQRLMDEFGHTQEALAKALGKSRSAVANTLRLNNLPHTAQNLLRDGRLSAGHARAVLAAKDPEGLAARIAKEGLSVREAEKLAGEDSARPAKTKTAKKPEKDIDTLALEGDLENILGMKISVNSKPDQSGSITISYRSLDQLDEVIHRLSQIPKVIESPG